MEALKLYEPEPIQRIARAKPNKNIKPKRWKRGEMKAYLAEQKALERGRQSRERADEKAAYLDMWRKYIQSIYMDTITKHVAKATVMQGGFSSAEPVNPQYDWELLKSGAPLVIERHK